MTQDTTPIACDRCRGMGWVRIRMFVRDEHGIAHDRSDYPDCPRCKGTGIEPPDAPEIDRG